jgi:hypothetical protein
MNNEVFFPQLLLVSICLLIPLICLLKKRGDLLSYWLCVAASIDIFNSQALMNLTAFKLTGLVVAPVLAKNIFHWWQLKPIKVLTFFFLLLVVLGLYFGQIFPWVDETGMKTGRDIPQWRSLLHLGSLALELSAALFLASSLTSGKIIKNCLLIIMGCLALSILFAWVERITHFDFYRFMTLGNKLPISFRVRGLNFEPRGLAQASAYLFLFTLMPILKSFRARLALMLLSVVALFVLAFSPTGIIIFAICSLAVLCMGIVHKKSKKILKLTFLASIFFSITIALVYQLLSDTYRESLKNHFAERSYLFSAGSFVDKLEIYDAAAVNFLLNNPKYLILGTGPGLISTPVGRKYLVDRDKRFAPNGFVELPFMGLILIISNGGFVALSLFIYFLILIFKDGLKCLRQDKLDLSEAQFLIFVSLSLCYFFQMRPIFYLGLAFGLNFSIRQASSQLLKKLNFVER